MSLDFISRIKEIEKWRDNYATPNIKNNNTLIKDTKTSLTSYINTEVNKAKNILKNYTDNITNNLKGYTDNITNQINIVANNAIAKADNATSKANSAISKANSALAEIPIAVAAAKTSLTKYTNTEINNAKNTIKTYVDNSLSNFEIKVSKAFNEAEIILKQYTEELVKQVKTAADTALTYSKDALAKAQTLVNKLIATGKQLGIDVGALKLAGEDLVSILATEVNNIKSRFIAFGQNLKDSAIVIANNTIYVKNEFLEATNQIQVPLKMVNSFAKKCKNENIIFLPFNIFMTLYWAFLKGFVI